MAHLLQNERKQRLNDSLSDPSFVLRNAKGGLLQVDFVIIIVIIFIIIKITHALEGA